MPTELTATISELSLHAQQLAVAPEPAAKGRRFANFGRSLRIQITVSVEVAASGAELLATAGVVLRASNG